ncbi:MAG: nitroreductase family protein [Bilophila sp.]
MATLPGRYQQVGEAFRSGHDPILRGAPGIIFALGHAATPWNALDCTAAVSYLELALHSYGVGSCWSGFVIAAANNGVDLGPPHPRRPQNLRGAHDRLPRRRLHAHSPAQARALDGGGIGVKRRGIGEGEREPLEKGSLSPPRTPPLSLPRLSTLSNPSCRRSPLMKGRLRLADLKKEKALS